MYICIPIYNFDLINLFSFKIQFLSIFMYKKDVYYMYYM